MKTWKVLLLSETECRERNGVFQRVKEVDEQIYGICKFLIKDDESQPSLSAQSYLDPEALN
jgi:hypothetical protein